MATEIRERVHRRDRWVSWIIISVFVVALILGWVVKTTAEGRTVVCEAAGVHTCYPAGWVRADVQPPVLLQVENLWAASFRTTLRLERWPVPPNAEKPLNVVQSTVALERGRNWTAYRMLLMEEGVSINGRTGMRIAFAYVETNPNPFLETVPVVMRGEDYLFPVGNQVYIATLTAAEANHAQAQKALLAFVRSLQMQE